MSYLDYCLIEACIDSCNWDSLKILNDLDLKCYERVNFIKKE